MATKKEPHEQEILRQSEVVEISALRPHPRNYKRHPEEQLEHLVESIRQHGFYRNVVVANDNTILAGHGVVEAAKKLAMKRVTVVKMPFGPDDVRALKLLAGDNEISNLAADNDRILSEMLKEIKDVDENGLLGTGFDEMMLAALVMTTRGKNEIADMSEAAEWVGMPEFNDGEIEWTLTVKFKSESDREAFYEKAGLSHEFISSRGERKQATTWPQQARQDMGAFRIESDLSDEVKQ